MISTFKRIFGKIMGSLLLHTSHVEIATEITAHNHTQNVGDEDVRTVRTACAVA